MSLVDKFVFEGRGAHGCSNSDYEFVMTTCCEKVGVVDEELGAFYWSADTPSRSVTTLGESVCPFCEASKWDYRRLNALGQVPEHWRWACDGRPRPGSRVVRALDDYVAELLEFCRGVAAPIPSFGAIAFLNTRDPRVRYEEGWIAEISALQAIADFRPVFDRMLMAGYAWINLSTFGIFRGNLVIGVELPREQTGVPPGRTSVNYSGPARNVKATATWDFGLTLTD